MTRLVRCFICFLVDQFLACMDKLSEVVGRRVTPKAYRASAFRDTYDMSLFGEMFHLCVCLC
jgi:hypothetical protein